MTVCRGRRARALALVVPVVMSAAMWLVVGEQLLGRYGPAVLLVVVPVLAAAASTRVGERWVAHLFMRARAPRLHQRHTLASVAEVLMRQGVPPERFVLLVGPGWQVDVNAIGRRTVVVSQGLVEGVRSGQLARSRRPRSSRTSWVCCAPV
jgi:Zn-dependent protease with chaperone function